MKCEKSLWFEVGGDTSVDVLDKVCQLEYNILTVNSSTLSKLDEIKLPQRIRLGYIVSSVEELENGKVNEEFWGKVDYVIADSINLWEEIKNSTDVKAGLIIDV